MHGRVIWTSKRFGRAPYPAPFPFGTSRGHPVKDMNMLNKMSLLLATAAISLCAGSADAANFANGNQHRPGGSSLSIDIGNVAFGFNDGYWDTGHHWHTWRNNAERTNYSTHGANFHSYNHTRDHNNGWRDR